MAEELSKSDLRSCPAAEAASSNSRSWWPSLLRWTPNSTDHIIAVKTPYVQEKVNIGPAPPGSKIRWFRSSSDEPGLSIRSRSMVKMIRLCLLWSMDMLPPRGFFFQNFDALASRFRVIAIDQLGWGGSSRPDFTCKSTEETEAWFIDSFEEWQKGKNIMDFIFLGHSFVGYVAAKYALKHPEHVKHLILVGSAGFSYKSDSKLEWSMYFRATWKGAILNHLGSLILHLTRGLGPWGPDLVRNYTSARFDSYSNGSTLNDDEAKLLTDYVYQMLAAKASVELCLKYIFSFGAFTKSPLLHSNNNLTHHKLFLKILGKPVSIEVESAGYICIWLPSLDELSGGQEARKDMKVACKIIRLIHAGHFVFIDNPSAFHSAVFYACRKFLSPDPDCETLPEGRTST